MSIPPDRRRPKPGPPPPPPPPGPASTERAEPAPVDSAARTTVFTRSPAEELERLGPYELLASLGAGAMGAVLKARDTRNGQLVALKQLFDVDPASVYRLKREFRRMAGITHENLVTLYELSSVDERWFFTMELLTGVSLREATRAGLDDDCASLRRVVRQLTRGVHALHQAGKIHRDLKPANVLVTPEGRVVILDYGLVDEIDHRTLFNSGADLVHGTPAYMAPEQAAGQFATPAADWYAVGVILFEAVTGRFPFPGTAMTMLMDKQCQEAPRLSTLVPEVPAALDDLVASLLRPIPAERAGARDILAWCAGDDAQLSTRMPTLSTGELIEREAPIYALHEALAQVHRGHTARVDIVGAAGVGKTALVRRFAAQAAGSGALCLEGRCSQRESVPFRAFDGLLDALTAHLVRLPDGEREPLLRSLGGRLHALAQIFPVLARVEAIARQSPTSLSEAHELRQQAFQALKVLLFTIAERRPTILFLDDLQWGDVDSAHLLGHLLAAPAVPPLLFVLAYRRGESRMLGDLALQQQLITYPFTVQVFELQPLSQSGAVTLATRLLRPPIDARRTRLAHYIAGESGGNPALLHTLVEETERVGGEEGLTVAGEGDLLRRLVRARLARVAPEARELFGRIVVAAGALSMTVLARAGTWQGDVLALVAQLRGQGLVQVEGEVETQTIMSFSEPIEQAARALLGPTLLRRCHADLATALIAAEPEASARIARHLYAAGMNDEAFEYASTAAYAASKSRAFGHAVELYQLALECKPGLWTLQQNCGDALVQAGRGAEAADLFLAAAGAAPPAAATRLRRKAAEHLLNHGYLERGEEILRPLLVTAGLDPAALTGDIEDALRDSAAQLVTRGLAFTEHSEVQLASGDRDAIDLWWTAGKGLLLNDPSRAGYFLLKCTRLALDAGEPRRVARSLALCGLFYSGRSHPFGSVMIAEALRLGERIRDAYAVGLATLCKGIAARMRGEWLAAMVDLDRGEIQLREQDPASVWEHGLGQASTMVALEAMGELRVMGERAEALLRRAQETGDVHSSLVAAIYSALTLLAGGQPAQARARVREALAHWPRKGFQVQHLHALKIGVYCDLYEGRFLDAWTRVSNTWPALEDSDFLHHAARRAEALQLRARAALGALRVAPGQYQHLAAMISGDIAQLEQEGHPHLRGEAALLRAGLAVCAGDGKLLRQHLDIAVRSFQATGMSLNAVVVGRLRTLHFDAAAGPTVTRHEAHMRMQNIVDVNAWSRIASPTVAL